MNKIAVCLSTIVVVSIAVGETVKSSGLTPDQLSAKKAEYRRLSIARAGGMISEPLTGGVIRVANTSAKVKSEMIDKKLADMRFALDLPIRVSNDASLKTAFLLEVKDADAAPTILTAPEQGWAQVNVSALMKDAPSQDVLDARVIKEIWRATALALGAGYSHESSGLLSPMMSVKDLDSVKALAPTPEPYNQMVETARFLGVQRVRSATYRSACKQGWAPAPTNDIQKAIWDKVYELPTQPLKLEK